MVRIPSQTHKKNAVRGIAAKGPESQTLNCRSWSMPNRAVYVKNPKRHFYVTAETITVDAI